MYIWPKLYFYVMEKFCDFFTLRPSDLNTTFICILMDNYCFCYKVRSNLQLMKKNTGALLRQNYSWCFIKLSIFQYCYRILDFSLFLFIKLLLLTISTYFLLIFLHLYLYRNVDSNKFSFPSFVSYYFFFYLFCISPFILWNLNLIFFIYV